jgi:hypothetical protein
MKKKFYLVSLTALLGASLFLIGCGDAETGAAGAPGSVGPVYLSGGQTTAGIQDALASGAPVVFAGVEQSDAGEVIIPAGKGVKLVGTAAYTTYSSGGGVLIVEAASSVTGTGVLISGHAGSPVIVPGGVLTGGGAVVEIQDGSGVIAPAAAFAVKGPVTVSSEATSKTNIRNDTLGTNTLYVIGDVTVSAAISTATKITVTGNAAVTADETGAVVWVIKGDLDAQKKPTAGAGTLTVGGNAVFAEAVSGIAGAVAIGGNAEFKNALATGAGAVAVGGNLSVTGAASLGGNLTVGGTAAFSSTLTNSAAAVAAFNGATTVTGAVTTGTGGLTIAGKGAAELKAAPVVDTGKLLTVSNSGGVTLGEGMSVKTLAGGLTISGGGKAVLPDGKVITSEAAGTVLGTHWSLGTAAGTATATGSSVVFTAGGVKGAASGAKLSLAASQILVGLTDADDIGAGFDAVDVYLASGAAQVKVLSGASGTNATTLTLANGAKISGLTGAGAASAGTDVTALPGTSAASAGITNIIAVTGTASAANANNYFGIKTGETSGTITAAASGGAKDYTVVTTTVASAAGA